MTRGKVGDRRRARWCGWHYSSPTMSHRAAPVPSGHHENRDRGWKRNRRRRGGARARAARARGPRPVAARAASTRWTCATAAGSPPRSPASRWSSTPPTATARCSSTAPRGSCAPRPRRACGTTSASRSSASIASAGATTRPSSRRKQAIRALGRPVDDRARDAVPHARGAHVRGECQARHRALGRDPDAARRSTRGRPRAGRDGRGRALAGDHAVRRPGGRSACASWRGAGGAATGSHAVPVRAPGARARCAPAG